MLKNFLIIIIVFPAALVLLPCVSSADKVTTCTIVARKDVQVEVHDFSKDRKGPTIWQGNLSKGNRASIQARGGEILIEWRDLSQDNPRSQNRNDFCDGNTILVP